MYMSSLRRHFSSLICIYIEKKNREGAKPSEKWIEDTDRKLISKFYNISC